MIRFLRDIRLVPILLFATISLFALKTIGLLIDGHYTLVEVAGRNGDGIADVTGSVPGAAGAAHRAPKSDANKPDAKSGKPAGEQSWAQQMFNYPDVTGAVGDGKPAENKPAEKENKPAEKPALPKGDRAKATAEESAGTAGWKPVDGGRAQSVAEMAILERLQERRTELDARSKDVEMRESLLKAAEKRLEVRINELKDLETRVNTMMQQRDEGEAARFKNVVVMYENMKAKDAAKIFDRLDSKILLEVASQINARRMSDILAQMLPETAERLTVELAARSAAKDKAAELPKIEGKPVN
jgi:flagellar motility protein MotE (MotC chaperone)